MSTRTQVKVTDGETSLSLYHHTDGYPSYMLPLIKKAWETYGKGWEGARVGKVASFLCAVDPGVFEPEDSLKLHGDIEYYYIVNCAGEMDISSKPVWKVSSYTVDFDFNNELSESERLYELDTETIDKMDDEYIKKIAARV